MAQIWFAAGLLINQDSLVRFKLTLIMLLLDWIDLVECA